MHRNFAILLTFFITTASCYFDNSAYSDDADYTNLYISIVVVAIVIAVWILIVLIGYFRFDWQGTRCLIVMCFGVIGYLATMNMLTRTQARARAGAPGQIFQMNVINVQYGQPAHPVPYGPQGSAPGQSRSPESYVSYSTGPTGPPGPYVPYGSGPPPAPGPPVYVSYGSGPPVQPGPYGPYSPPPPAPPGYKANGSGPPGSPVPSPHSVQPLHPQ